MAFCSQIRIERRRAGIILKIVWALVSGPSTDPLGIERQEHDVTVT